MSGRPATCKCRGRKGCSSLCVGVQQHLLPFAAIECGIKDKFHLTIKVVLPTGQKISTLALHRGWGGGGGRGCEEAERMSNSLRLRHLLTKLVNQSFSRVRSCYFGGGRLWRNTTFPSCQHSGALEGIQGFFVRVDTLCYGDFEPPPPFLC